MKYDLLIAGGDVVDPGAGLRGRMDVAIKGGRIAEVAPSLRPEEAAKVVQARGKFVTPGLIDIHTHIFIDASDMGSRTDSLCRSGGVTTICDAGSSGAARWRRPRPVT